MLKKSLFLALALLAVGLTVVQAQSSGWPNAAKLAQYSLNNMPRPVGMGDIEWRDIPPNGSAVYNYKYNVLHISFGEGTPATHNAILAWFNNNGWTFKDPPTDFFGAQYRAVFVKGTYQADYVIMGQNTSEANGYIVVGNTSVNAPSPSQLVTPAGKAWVIKDNNIQGSGKTLIFKADGRLEGYDRIYGIWVPSLGNTFSVTTYTATGTTRHSFSF